MSGIRFGIDVGKARIGVARSVPGSFLAFPLETVATYPHGIQRVFELIQEAAPEIVYIGLPVSLQGNETASTQMAREFGHKLLSIIKTQELKTSLRFIDERGSTKLAIDQFHGAGRTIKQTKHVVDQQAAVNILQLALDGERHSASLPGTVVEDEKQQLNEEN